MNPRTSPEPLWRKRLAAVIRAWPAMRRGDVEALHRVRVASRRIREALPVIAAGADGAKLKKLGRRVRNVTRALGPLRELDVEVGVLAKLERTAPSHRAAIERVRRSIVADRKAIRERVIDHVDGIDPKKLIRKLARLAARSGVGRNKTNAAAWRNALAARAVRRAKRLREAIDRAGALYVPDRLHAVRIAAKKLRYVLEVAEGTGVSRLAALIRSLKDVQQMLGRLNDLQSLLDRLHDVEASADTGSEREDFRGFAQSLERECRRLHAEFVVRREALLELCDVARRELARQISVGRPRPARALPTRTRQGAATAASATPRSSAGRAQ